MKKALPILAFLLASCAASGPRFMGLDVVNPENSGLYIYRPSNFVNSGVYPTVSVDGIEISELKNGGFVYVEVSPGEHSIELDGSYFVWPYSSIELTVNTEKGETKFYRIGSDADFNPFVTTTRIGLVEVNEKFALNELPELHKVN